MLLMQEAFETRMSEFVSRSRERQRYIRLRSQERRLQQLAADERRRLFGDIQPQRLVLSLSEPAVGMLINTFLCIVIINLPHLLQHTKLT